MTKRKNIGDIAKQYLRQLATTSGADKTVGLRDKNGKFFIGNIEARTKENNLFTVGKAYDGTPRVWELIVSKRPDAKIVIDEDIHNYVDIVLTTNALSRNNDYNETNPKASKSWKWIYVKINFERKGYHYRHRYKRRRLEQRYQSIARMIILVASIQSS